MNLKNSLALLTVATALVSVVNAQILLDDFNSGMNTISGTTWVGQVTQTGGYITVASTAKDDNGWGRSSLNITPTGMNFVTIVGKQDTGNLAPSFTITFVNDIDLTDKSFTVPMSSFLTGATTVSIPISTWGTLAPSGTFTSWSIGGGDTIGGSNTFRMTLYDLLLTPTAIPEPSTYAFLAGLGALGVAWVRRRNQHLG